MKPTTAITAAALAAAATTLPAGDEMPVAELPAPVVAAATADEGAVIVEAERDTEDGQVVYEVEVRVGTIEKEFTIAADGTVLEVEEEVALADVPAEILALAQAAATGATFTEAEKETEGDAVEWTLEGRDDQGRLEVEVEDGEAELERRDGDKDDDREDEAAEGGSNGF